MERATVPQSTLEAEKIALRLASLVGRLAAVVEWCVEHDGECLGDNLPQLAYAKALLREAKLTKGRE